MRMQLGALILVAGVTLMTACGATAATGGVGAGVAVPVPVSATGAQQVAVTVGNSMHFASRKSSLMATLFCIAPTGSFLKIGQVSLISSVG